MKLKNLLEQSEKEIEEAIELNKKLNSEYKNNEKNLIYRAEGTPVTFWTEKEIRKDRKPLDTNIKIDAIVHYLERNYYQEVPSRRRSKFGVGEKNLGELNKYGPEKLVCFPHKSANVYSLGSDATKEYFTSASEGLRTSFSRWYRNQGKNPEIPKELERFFEIYEYEVYKDPNSEIFPDLLNFISNNWKGLSDKAKNFNPNQKIEKQIILKFLKFVNNIEGYFNNLKQGVDSNAKEILFNGPKYLLINKGFFKDFFEWDGEWKIYDEIL